MPRVGIAVPRTLHRRMQRHARAAHKGGLPRINWSRIARNAFVEELEPPMVHEAPPAPRDLPSDGMYEVPRGDSREERMTRALESIATAMTLQAAASERGAKEAGALYGQLGGFLKDVLKQSGIKTS